MLPAFGNVDQAATFEVLHFNRYSFFSSTDTDRARVLLVCQRFQYVIVQTHPLWRTIALNEKKWVDLGLRRPLTASCLRCPLTAPCLRQSV
jgi:hypothetical protein